jgi:phenylalanyl-tRNA synthetase beta chain
MRIPLTWLKEFVSTSLSPEEITNQLTLAGLEVEGYEIIGESLQDIVVGNVLEVNKHPNADQLNVAIVTDGKEHYQVVCGAPNCRPGIKVALARVGSSLKDGEGIFLIKKAKIRGIESCGMLCSEKELGLSEEHEGILELPASAQEGVSLTTLFGDIIFEISFTPNLSYATSVRGIARELALFTSEKLQNSVNSLREQGSSIHDFLKVDITDQDLCERYTCRLIKNVQIGPSPQWLVKRLAQCGIRSINNVVDITNYVLLEFGHPLHAFDYDKIKGQQLIIRKAHEKESLHTIAHKDYHLQADMLVIADQEKALALAGIIGGVESEVTENTRHIVVEAACFAAANIRRTSKSLQLQTDAAKRFERGTDPNQLLESLDRAVFLIQEVAGGEIQTGYIDKKNTEFTKKKIPCRLNRVNNLLGLKLSRGEIEDFFNRLQFDCTWDENHTFIVHVPTYRTDIQSEIDLIKEVMRLYGYENIERIQSPYVGSILPSDKIYLFEKKLCQHFIAEGLQECITCPLIGPTLLGLLSENGKVEENQIQVLNPSSIEQSILRTTLLPGLLQVVKHNIDHGNSSFAGFEIGRIHFLRDEQCIEQSVVGIILTGARAPHYWKDQSKQYEFFDLKGITENLLYELGITGASFKNLELSILHSGRQASIFVGSLEIGSIGEIHPTIQRRLGVSQKIFFGEFNIHDLLKIGQPVEKVKSISIYPGSTRDWTCTIHCSVSFEEILKIIRSKSSKFLDEVFLKDIYKSEKLHLNYQNMTLRFIYRDTSKTIEQEQVEAEHQKLIQTITMKLSDKIQS